MLFLNMVCLTVGLARSSTESLGGPRPSVNGDAKNDVRNFQWHDLHQEFLDILAYVAALLGTTPTRPIGQIGVTTHRT
jgi:hypothetical protein